MTGKLQWIGLGAVLLCAACTQAADQSATASANSSESRPVTPVDVPGAQSSQRALVAAIDAGRNDGAFCAAFQKQAGFDDWTARISDFRTSTVNQSIDITFDAGRNVQLEQVVQVADPLYATISGLRMQEQVRLSGRFSHGNSECGYRLGVIGVQVSKIARSH